MRLQVMHLPAPPDEYPFLLIIDGFPVASQRPSEMAQLRDVLSERTGARTVLFFEQEVEVL